MIIDRLGECLKMGGYFDDLEGRLKKNSESQDSHLQGEIKRLNARLKEVDQSIANIWQFQKSGKLDSEAIEMASQELNSLAKEKAASRSYLSQLEETLVIDEEIKDQVSFVSEKMRQVVKGWAKATPPARKRLLRRLVRSIVVSRKEIKITFWLDEHAYQKLQKTGGNGSPEGGAKVIQFSNFSSTNQDQNDKTNFSSIRKIGRG